MGKSCDMCGETQKCPQGFGVKRYGNNHFEGIIIKGKILLKRILQK